MTSKKFDEDAISHCGSFAGETFSSRRTRKGCTLRQHSINNVAAQLRHMSQDTTTIPDIDGLSCMSQPVKERFNTVFHYYRFIIVMMGGLSVGIVMLLRYNITVAILNMVNQTALYMEEHPNRTMDDFLADGYLPGGDFNWDNEIQHMIMSWYMVAYTLPQILSTKLGSIIGSRLTIPISLGICTISTLLLPPLAYYGWEYVIILRLINGVGASAVIPMLLSLVEQWMPYDQISVGLTSAQLLQALTSAANPLVSGYLSSIHWSWAFYGPGAFTIVFCILWLILVTDTPDDNLFISQKELDMICCCSDADHDHASEKKANLARENEADPVQRPSWRLVLKEPTFYYFMIMWCFYCSAYSTFVFVLPTYLRQFMKIPISQNGFYCFIIGTGQILSVLWPHLFLSSLRNRFKLSETASRRITEGIVCTTSFATWTYVGCSNQSQIPLLFLNRVFHGANDVVVTGTLMSNYAKAGLSSLVFSMINTIGNLTIVFVSTFVGWVLDYTGQSALSWAYIFTGLGVSQLVFGLMFVTLIRAGPIELGPKEKKRSQIEANIEVAAKATNPIMNNFEKLSKQSIDK